MKVGVIGLGYWGPNLVRNFLAHSDVTKVIACDAREDRLKFVKEKFPSVELAKDCEVLAESNVHHEAICRDNKALAAPAW